MNKLLPSVVLYALLTSNTNAQCTVEINAPSIAISNCIGPSISATHSGPSPINYVWSVSSMGSLSNPSDASPTVSSSGPGQVIVTLIAYDSTFCTATDIDTINFVAPFDTFAVEHCTLPTTICPFDIPLIGPASWTYIDGGGSSTSIPTDSLNCVLANTEGAYQLFAIYESNCTVIHTYMVTDTCATTSVEAIALNASFDLYPNPTHGNVSIKANETIETIYLLDAVGQTMATIPQINQPVYELSLQKLKAGNYFIKIQTTKKGYSVKRLVKIE